MFSLATREFINESHRWWHIIDFRYLNINHLSAGGSGVAGHYGVQNVTVFRMRTGRDMPYIYIGQRAHIIDMEHIEEADLDRLQSFRHSLSLGNSEREERLEMGRFLADLNDKGVSVYSLGKVLGGRESAVRRWIGEGRAASEGETEWERVCGD
jgi:hypothetical protein